MDNNFKIFTGQANIPFAEKVCMILGKKISDVEYIKFADGELSLKVLESVRGQDIFIIQSISSPVNDNLMELLIIIDAIKRSSAKSISIIVPYFAYARQDRSTSGRQPITAKLVANMISSAGANRVMMMEPHTLQMLGFFDIPVDGLSGCDAFLNYFAQIDGTEEEKLNNYILVSPDVGGVERVRKYANHFDNMPIAVINKRRDKPGSVSEMYLVGDVRGKHAIIIDDMVDSGGTLCKAANLVLENGAIDVSAFIVHGILSHNAKELIENSKLKKLVITDTIKQGELPSKIKVTSIAPLVAEVIERVYSNQSLSDLF